jgi:ABC-type sugar transport system ATPase subunit
MSGTSSCRSATCAVLRGRSGAGKTTLLNLIAGVAPVVRHDPRR